MSSHDEFMEVICGVCARKGANPRKRDAKRRDKQKLGNLKPISDRILELIHTHHFPNYVIGSCPKVVCASCVKALEEAEKNGTEAKRKLPDTDYSQFQVPRRTRASDCCTCRWCWVGKLKAQQYTNYCKSVMNKRGRPPTRAAPSTQDTTVAKCQYCHSIKAPGVAHNCSKKDRNNNLAAMVRDVSPDSQEKVVCQLINDICEDKNVKKKSDNLVLVSGNNKKQVVNFGPKKALPQWSIQEMIEFGNDKVVCLIFHILLLTISVHCILELVKV